MTGLRREGESGVTLSRMRMEGVKRLGLARSSAPLRRGWRELLLTVVVALLGAVGCERSIFESLFESEPAGDDVEPALDAETQTRAALASTRGEPGSADAAGRREVTWSFDQGAFGPTDVVISMPDTTDPKARFPVLVALHGRGEALKGSRLGARGWLDDYDLEGAMVRLDKPPLREGDFQGYVSSDRLRRINRDLSERPYGGLIIVCPFLPDVLRRENAFTESETLAAFIVDVLLPRVYAKTPAIGTPAATGIDGVSLGGRASLLVGFARPNAFGAIGALQAAIDAAEVDRFAELGARALAQNPKLSFRLLTSDSDHFQRVNWRLSEALAEKRVPHTYTEVMGTHSYRFNRGPGGIEMLLFHDRVLRGLPWD